MALTIDESIVGFDHPPFVVAEIGMNHNGDIELGKKMVREAAGAGADAVKFQTFRTDRFLAPSYDGRDQYRQYELSRQDHEVLKQEADDHGTTFLSTPFDRESVDLLEELDVPCFKVASSDLTNLPLIRYIAGHDKPIILSTGYASLSEVAATVEMVRESGNDKVILLHCLSSYPAPLAEMNLSAIKTLHETFDLPVGLSDHTKGTPVAPIIATAFGASVIEKHFTTDDSLPGFDHEMSESPDTFSELVDTVKMAHEAIGDGRKRPQPSEREARERARRSLYWSGAFEEGSVIHEDMMVELRPGTGLPPTTIDTLVGHQLSDPVDEFDRVSLSHIEWVDD